MINRKVTNLIKQIQGMFITSDQVEEFIDEQGKETLEVLKTNFQS